VLWIFLLVVEAVELAIDQAFERGRWMCGQLCWAKVFVAVEYDDIVIVFEVRETL